MNSKLVLSVLTGITVILATATTVAYPPAVGIMGKSRSCLNCHINNGNWVDGTSLIVDILDKETNKSLKQPDGSFLLSARRNQAVTVLTIIGYKTTDVNLIPHRNAWLYTDPEKIESSSLSKFPPGWQVNLPMACRLVGDKHEAYPDGHITVLPMTVRPSDSAIDGAAILQFMLTSGDIVKGDAKRGMTGDYFERTVRFRVIE